MFFWIAILLGAAIFAYIGLRPEGLGIPFPNLQGEWIVRPTLGRITGYFIGRWLGYLLLSLICFFLGRWLNTNLMIRLIYANTMLLAIFMFLFLTIHTSPEMSWARVTDPSRLNLSTFTLGWLSAFTLVSPLLISCFLALLQPSLVHSMFFFTNVFFGNALCSLPFLLNMQWVKTSYYQFFLKTIVLFCSLVILILSIMSFIKS